MIERVLIAVAMATALIAGPSVARDRNGNFIVGGGVGALGCPEFLNAMATARQKGGARSLAGVNEIAAYQYYVGGFETGFNSEAEGIYDIFASLGTDPTLKALYAIEPWCANNPDKTFGTALLVLAAKLRANPRF
jgi:hypothetical protein